MMRGIPAQAPCKIYSTPQGHACVQLYPSVARYYHGTAHATEEAREGGRTLQPVVIDETMSNPADWPAPQISL